MALDWPHVSFLIIWCGVVVCAWMALRERQSPPSGGQE